MKTSEKLRDILARKRTKVSRRLSQGMNAFKLVRDGEDIAWEGDDFWRGLSSAQPLRRIRD
jgi:hypothetical protein